MQEKVRAPISPPGQKKKGRRKNGRIILSSLQVLRDGEEKKERLTRSPRRAISLPYFSRTTDLFPVQSEGTPFSG